MYGISSKTLMLLMALLAATVCALADAPATRPAPMELRVRRWIDQLADNDGAVRDRARFNLMGLSSDDLPLLKQAAAAEMPLTLEQQAALRDVVCDVYLAGQTYQSVPTEGFLGLQWSPNGSISDIGQCVEMRLPGFAAYRYLQEGDIIVGIVDQPNVDCRNADAFRRAIAAMSPGQAVRLRILRRGEFKEVSIVLDERPAAADAPISAVVAEVAQWLDARNRAAADYWQANFVPVIGGDQEAASAN